jgi:hypothetical protein
MHTANPSMVSFSTFAVPSLSVPICKQRLHPHIMNWRFSTSICLLWWWILKDETTWRAGGFTWREDERYLGFERKDDWRRGFLRTVDHTMDSERWKHDFFEGHKYRLPFYTTGEHVLLASGFHANLPSVDFPTTSFSFLLLSPPAHQISYVIGLTDGWVDTVVHALMDS